MSAKRSGGLSDLLMSVDSTGRIPRVADVDPYAIGVHRTSHSGYKINPYIARVIDAQLDSLLRGKGTFVCVTGNSLAGKSRTAFEAARRTLPNASLLAPIPQPGVLSQLLDLNLIETSSNPIVVWLDDLDRYLDPSGVTGDVLSFLSADRDNIVILATIRSAVLDAIRQAGNTIGRNAQLILGPAHILSLAVQLTAPEAERARQLYPEAKFEYGIGDAFLAPRLLEERYTTSEETNPIGRALIQAAIDWHRAGMLRAIHEDELRELCSQYLSQRHPELSLSEEGYEQGLTWALSPVASLGNGLLIRIEEGSSRAYRVLDYLVAYTDERGDDIPESTWKLVIDHADREELEAIARAAILKGNATIAERALAQRLPGLRARARADLPSDEDTLNFEPLIKGLRDLLNHKDTGFPLAIAITAPWGGGKSSAMLQLRRLLETSSEGAEPSRHWYTVVFEAWKYERSERVWAALAKAIYDQPQSQMSWRKRTSFRLTLEFERHLDKQRYQPPATGNGKKGRNAERIRRWLSWTLFILKGLTPPLVALAVVGIAITRVKGPINSVGWWLGATASAATLLTITGRYWGILSDPFKRAIDRYTKKPDYAEQLGFTTEADGDIRCLTRVLTRDNESALAIFVDDLDRCTPKHVIEVIEAINQIFNSAEGRRCVFFLGMDRDVVAASVEVAYSDTVEYLKARSSPLADAYGYHFLSKIVQMSVSIPVPKPESMRIMLARLTGNKIPTQDSTRVTPSEEEVQRFETRIEERHPVNPADVVAVEERLSAGGNYSESQQLALEEAARRARSRRFGEDSPDVVGAEFEILQYLQPNPRQVKRFDNVFRLQLHVANSADASQLSFRPGQLVAFGKWIALRLRWPDLAATIDTEPEVLATLEDLINKASNEPNHDVVSTEIRERYARWLDDRSLRLILEDADEDRRVKSLLGLTSLLHVA
jgi:KAP family P-loop domain